MLELKGRLLQVRERDYKKKDGSSATAREFDFLTEENTFLSFGYNTLDAQFPLDIAKRYQGSDVTLVCSVRGDRFKSNNPLIVAVDIVSTDEG